MSNLPILSFTAFKSGFYTRFPDLSVFDCGNINLVKVVLEGLKVNYAAKGKISHGMDKPVTHHSLRLMLHRGRSLFGDKKQLRAFEKRLREPGSRPYLLVDQYPSRAVEIEPGRKVSFYFHNVARSLGREKTAVLQMHRAPGNSDFDIDLGDYGAIIRRRPLDRAEKEFRSRLIAFYKRVRPYFDAQEQLNVGCALERFFSDYRMWRYLLGFLGQEKIMLLCHYHQEGAIQAMREAGRTVLEAQHGLIATEDIFYCLPEAIRPVRNKALFPDHIFVYGEYWKQQLLEGFEFSPGQVHVAGYFPVEMTGKDTESVSSIRKWAGNRKVILVTTQTFLHEHFCRYVKWLAEDIRKNHLSQVVVVKTHPSEKKEHYADIENLEEVRVVQDALPALFAFADWHVSVYSTTLYDGIRYGVPGFSIGDLEPALEGYVQSITRDNIAVRISKHTNPANVPVQPARQHGREYFYAAYDPGILLDHFQGTTETLQP